MLTDIDVSAVHVGAHTSFEDVARGNFRLGMDERKPHALPVCVSWNTFNVM